MRSDIVPFPQPKKSEVSRENSAYVYAFENRHNGLLSYHVQPVGLGLSQVFFSIDKIIKSIEEGFFPSGSFTIKNLILDPDTPEAREHFAQYKEAHPGARPLNQEERQELVRLLEDKDQKKIE